MSHNMLGRIATILTEEVRVPVEIRLNANRRTLISYREAGKGRGRRLRLSIHRMFTDAPEPVLRAVGAWLDGRETSDSRATLRRFMNEREATGETPAENKVLSGLPAPSHPGELDWIEQLGNEDRTGKSLPPAPSGLQPQGRFHDLDAIARRINYQYFEGRCPVHITWSQAPADRLPDHLRGEAAGLRGRARRRGRRSRTILFGSYSAREHLVRIHPRLDAEDVPAWFVDYIVYHEMLHKAEPPRVLASGRRDVHTRRFRHLERRFPRFREAKLFERRFVSEAL